MMAETTHREWDPCPLCGLPTVQKYWNSFMCGTEMDQEHSIRKIGSICRAVQARLQEVLPPSQLVRP